MADDPAHDYLIIGGGQAAVSALDGIRDVDPDGTIVMLTAESEPPYQRPPLTKEYVRFPEAPRELLYIKPAGWFDEQEAVTLETSQRALVLDPREMRVTTARGNEYQGSRILIATGGRARGLEIPGSDLPGVLTVRNVGDSETLRALAATEGLGRVVLIGAGFIGLELAASLSAFNVESVLVEAEHQVWPRVLPASLAEWVQGYFEERGVSFRLGESVLGLDGSGGVERVLLAGGELECDLVVVGVGMAPNQEIAADAGLAVQDGVMVDPFGETSHAHIYASGDVARFPDPTFGGRTRVEHWEHAREHGRLVGRNMAGLGDPYEHLSYFWSDLFDLKLSVVGRPREAERTVLRGTPGHGPCIAFGIREGRLHAATLVDAQADLEPARALVRARTDAEHIVDRLADPETSLAELARKPGATASTSKELE